jgi:ribose 1,5-bisphosphokinase
MTQGRLVLIVGPSGAGKDSLLNFARARLTDRRDIIFPRRVITRPADATEDHTPASTAEFVRLDFTFSWQAHGLSYGISSRIEADLAQGSQVVINASRGIIEAARAKFPSFVIEITASPAALAQRLASRGRENGADIEKRLTRTALEIHADATILNDGTLEEGGTKLLSLLLTH